MSDEPDEEWNKARLENVRAHTRASISAIERNEAATAAEKARDARFAEYMHMVLAYMERQTEALEAIEVMLEKHR